MVVARFDTGAGYIGRLDQGQDITAGFRTVCRENSIVCGWISATAFVRCPVVSRLTADGTETTVQLDGTHFLPTITGSISRNDTQMALRLHVELAGPDAGSRVAGLLEGGEVLFCEFMITACGEVSLVRDMGGRFKPWVQIQAAGPTGSATGTLEPLPPRPVPVAMHAPAADDEASELNILEMKAGDYVDHPKFGVCRISADPVEDKISIRLNTGKQVDLSLGIMKVLEPRMVGGRRVFRLEIRRRNS